MTATLDINKPSGKHLLEERLSDGWEIKGFSAVSSFGTLMTIVLIIKEL